MSEVTGQPSVVEALLPAAAKVPVEPALAIDDLVLDCVDPLPVCTLSAAHGVSPTPEQAVHPLGQLVAVCGLGGDVVGGAGSSSNCALSCHDLVRAGRRNRVSSR